MAEYISKASAQALIRSIPAANVEKVVRCGECAKRFTKRCALWYGETVINGVAQNYFCGAVSIDDFYCAYGERKR